MTPEEIHAVIRKGVCTNKFNPVLCGSAFKNKGVQQLLDAVVNWLPSPIDRGDIKAHDLNTDEDIILTPADDAPFAALAFKIMTDPYVGRLTYIRIYSGTLNKGMTLVNSDQRFQRADFSRCWKCMRTNGKNAMNFSRVISLACIGLKKATTGIRYVRLKGHPILLEKMEFPEPVISMAIEPKSKADREKLSMALGSLSQEDPTFRCLHQRRNRSDDHCRNG